MDRHCWQFKKYEHHMRQRNGMCKFGSVGPTALTLTEGAGCEV